MTSVCHDQVTHLPSHLSICSNAIGKLMRYKYAVPSMWLSGPYLGIELSSAPDKSNASSHIGSNSLAGSSTSTSTICVLCVNDMGPAGDSATRT
eukprot:1271875-Pyramimonas_sp.AAC.1